MTRSSSILIATGILAAVLFACALPPPPPPPGQTSVAANCTFNASSVGVLASGYIPDPSSANYTPPGQNLQAGVSLSTQMINDINAAFANAPLAVQNDICALSGVFIDTNSCQNGTINPCTPLTNSVPNSWGYRSRNSTIDPGLMYVGIPASLWPIGNANAIPLDQYEQSVIQYFAQNAGNPNWGSTYPLPTVSTVIYNNRESSWPAVLAVLAHELGHVKFNYIVHPNNNHGKDYDFRNLTSCNIGGGNTINFFKYWTYNGNAKKLMPRKYWRQFGRQDNLYSTTRIDHSISPLLSDFQDVTQNPNSLLNTLYSNDAEPWASFWGAWSPDEDFVETYVLSALLSNVTSFPISISGYSSYDVIQNMTQGNKPLLYDKIQCVANLPTIGT